MIRPKVSVLIPIYNVSDFIERCAHSLFKQSFEDIEYVFVNDCTPDDSIEKLLKVIDLYPKRKDHIKIINNQTNKGLAYSRNVAIDNSNGSYIAVVDSDDYIEQTMIEVLYNNAIEQGADIVVSDFFSELSDKTLIINDNIDALQINNFHLIVKQENTYACLWNKLVIRELYERADCRVPEGLNYSEDRHVMTRIYYFAQKIVKVDQAFYHYVQYNSNSITKKITKANFENFILFWKLLDEFLIEKQIYDIYKNYTDLSKVEGKLNLIVGTHSYKLRKEYANLFKNEEKKYFSSFRKGEQLMIFFLSNQHFLLAHLLHLILVFKNKTIKNFL